MTRVEKTFAGRQLILETGRMAKLAHGACYLQYGETAVLATAVMQERPTHLPFFPLTVEYREKTYAAGKFPGGFIKREGRPSDKEILSARQIDRPIRPLFPDGFMYETQIIVNVLSADQENDADLLGLLGASVALNMSKIPFAAPVAAAAAWFAFFYAIYGTPNPIAPWGGTALYDVIVKGLQQLSTQPGRRVLVIFSDGASSSTRSV